MGRWNFVCGCVGRVVCVGVEGLVERFLGIKKETAPRRDRLFEIRVAPAGSPCGGRGDARIIADMTRK